MSEEEPFGQKTPPLDLIIRDILERYPDGQIFKVRNNGNVATLRSFVRGLYFRR